MLAAVIGGRCKRWLGVLVVLSGTTSAVAWAEAPASAEAEKTRLQAELASQEARHQDLHADYDKQRNRARSAQEEVARLRADNARLVERIDKLNRALEASNAALAAKEGELAALSTELAAARAESDAMRTELEVLEAARTELETERDEARRLREELETLERRLVQAGPVDDRVKDALSVARLKTEARIQDTEVRLQRAEGEVVAKDAALRQANERATEAAHKLADTSDQLVRSQESVARQSLAIGSLILIGLVWLIRVAIRSERQRGASVRRAWTMLKPLLTCEDAALGPVEVAALREMVVSAEAAHRQRQLVAAGVKMVLATGAAGLLISVVDSAVQGFWDKPLVLGDLLTGNLMTFLIGAGGPLGLLMGVTKTANDRLQRAIEAAQKLGISERLRVAASRPEFADSIEQYWYWPERPPAQGEDPTAEVPPVDVHPVA